jgi:2-iminoacetate synthase
MGLDDWRVDSAITLLHGRHLTTEYWKTQVQVSFPRITAAPGGFTPAFTVTDRDLAHAVIAARLALPDSPLTISTREKAELRDNLLPLGITSMSAGSKTEPGGYGSTSAGTGQFTIEDPRTPEEIYHSVKKMGFEAVWKDWDRAFI